MKRLLMFMSLLLVFCLVYGYSTDVRQVFPEKSAGQFDAVAYVEHMQMTYDWLIAEAAPLNDKSVISVVVSDEEIKQVESYQCTECNKNNPEMRRVRIGIVKPLAITFNQGVKKSTPDGGYAWTISLVSETATALRVHFTDVKLPENAALYIYNAAGQAFGPYTYSGEFWSHTVTGPIVYVQLRHFGPAPAHPAPFKISGLGYLGKKFLLPFMQKDKALDGIGLVEGLCSENEPCVEDASCYSGGAVDDAKLAVAHMQWVSGVWLYYCSGGLVADTDPSTQIPYFLTANHCLSKARDAAGLECYFQYWTASCGGACYDPVGAVPRTLGASILSTDRTGDYTLLQLAQDPPAGSTFMGWTNTPVAFAGNTELFRISHPSGSPQAYSKHRVDADETPCSGWPRGDWIYSRDVIGATEGGSSGSPVYNMDGQIVGQLSGACGYNVNDPCDSTSNCTVDGAFASYFDAVATWLDTGGTPGGGTLHVDSIVLSVKIKAPFITGIATVTIKDENGAAVADATVSGTFTGNISGDVSGTTDENGSVTLSLKKKATDATFTFCVNNVSHASLTYDDNANLETCDTY